MYTKSHCNTNRKIISSPSPIPATLRGKLFPFPSLSGLLCSAQLAMTGLFMLTITWTTKSFWILVSCRRVLSVSSFPEKNHLWRDTSISSCSSSCFLSSAMESAMLAVRRTSFPEKSPAKQKQSWHRFPKHAVRKQWIIHESPVWVRQDAIKCGAPRESCTSRSLSHPNVTSFMQWRSQRGARTCWQSHSQLELLPARRGLSLLLCGFRNFALVRCFCDEVDGRSQSVCWELVTVAQLIVALRERACGGTGEHILGRSRY